MIYKNKSLTLTTPNAKVTNKTLPMASPAPEAG